MKKILAGVLALLFATGGFAGDYETGEAVTIKGSSYKTYKFLNTGFYCDAYVAGVVRDGDTEFYNVEILTMVSPAGSRSATGVHSAVTRYRVKEGDSIQAWKEDAYGIGNSRVKLLVKSIGDNHIELEETK